MDHPNLCIRAITLAYLESHTNKQGIQSTDLLNKVIESITGQEKSASLDASSEAAQGLKNVLCEIVSRSVSDPRPLDRADLLQQIKLASPGLDDLYIAATAGIGPPESDPQGFIQQAYSIRVSLSSYFREQDLLTQLGKAYATLKYKRSTIADIDGYISGIRAGFEEISKTAVANSVVGQVAHFDCSDEESGVALMDDSEKRLGKPFILGKQALNTMMFGGVRMSDHLIVTPALKHCRKSDFALECMADIAQLNDPPADEEGLKPLILRFSFENDMPKDIKFLFGYLYLNKFGVYPKDIKMSIRERTQFVMKELRCRGFYLEMIQANPSAWSYRNILDLVAHYRAKGFRVISLWLDYLPLIPLTNLGHDRHDQGVAMLYRKVKNCAMEGGFFCWTPHQFNSEVLKLHKEGKLDILPDVVDKSCYKDSTSVGDEVYVELNLHLFQKDGAWWFGVAKGKHRGADTKLPDSQRFAYWRMPPEGPLARDIGKEPSHRAKPGVRDTEYAQDAF